MLISAHQVLPSLPLVAGCSFCDKHTYPSWEFFVVYMRFNPQI